MTSIAKQRGRRIRRTRVNCHATAVTWSLEAREHWDYFSVTEISHVGIRRTFNALLSNHKTSRESVCSLHTLVDSFVLLSIGIRLSFEAVISVTFVDQIYFEVLLTTNDKM